MRSIHLLVSSISRLISLSSLSFIIWGESCADLEGWQEGPDPPTPPENDNLFYLHSKFIANIPQTLLANSYTIILRNFSGSAHGDSMIVQFFISNVRACQGFLWRSALHINSCRAEWIRYP